MNGQGPAAALAAAAVLTCWCGGAEAYRPFDGTDAAVAETGEMEIELGPVEYFREGSERALFAPDVRFNYGRPCGNTVCRGAGLSTSCRL